MARWPPVFWNLPIYPGGITPRQIIPCKILTLSVKNFPKVKIGHFKNPFAESHNLIPISQQNFEALSTKFCGVVVDGIGLLGGGHISHNVLRLPSLLARETAGKGLNLSELAASIWQGKALFTTHDQDLLT